MTPAWANAWATVIASGVAVTSALIAFFSWRISRRALRLGAATIGTSDLVLKADELFLRIPELRPYFYDGWPVPDAIFDRQPPSPPGQPLAADQHTRNQLLAAAEFYLDILECLWDNCGSLPQADQVAYREWIHDMFETGPVLGCFLEKFPAWYPSLSGMFARGGCSRRADHPGFAASAAPEPSLQPEPPTAEPESAGHAR